MNIYVGPRSGAPEIEPYGQAAREYGEPESRVDDPTTLILIDEADLLRMASLEQVRAIFDAQEIGMILIRMPGLEKRLARYPQFYSRIGYRDQMPMATRFNAKNAKAIVRIMESDAFDQTG